MKTLNSEQLLQARTEEIYSIMVHPEHLNWFKSNGVFTIQELEKNLFLFKSRIPVSTFTEFIRIPTPVTVVKLNGEHLYNHIKQRVAKIPGGIVITIDRGAGEIYIEEQKIETHILLGFGGEHIEQLNMILSWEQPI